MTSGGMHIISKPYGYPGDFFILELVYDKCSHPATSTSEGKIVDIWGLSKSLPCSVSARKDVLRAYLEKFASSVENCGNILSIASGSARELFDMLPPLLMKLKVSLVDFDENSLKFASNRLLTRAEKPSVEIIKGDVVRGEDFLKFISKKAPFDIIYSFGLFDYLPDKYIQKCISRFLPYLNDSGEFIFCLKDKRFYDRFIYDWMFDWKFVPRIFEYGFLLAEKIGISVKKTMVVEGRSIIIYICEKI